MWSLKNGTTKNILDLLAASWVLQYEIIHDIEGFVSNRSTSWQQELMPRIARSGRMSKSCTLCQLLQLTTKGSLMRSNNRFSPTKLRTAGSLGHNCDIS